MPIPKVANVIARRKRPAVREHRTYAGTASNANVDRSSLRCIRTSYGRVRADSSGRRSWSARRQPSRHAFSGCLSFDTAAVLADADRTRHYHEHRQGHRACDRCASRQCVQRAVNHMHDALGGTELHRERPVLPVFTESLRRHARRHRPRRQQRHRRPSNDDPRRHRDLDTGEQLTQASAIESCSGSWRCPDLMLASGLVRSDAKCPLCLLTPSSIPTPRFPRVTPARWSSWSPFCLRNARSLIRTGTSSGTSFWRRSRRRANPRDVAASRFGAEGWSRRLRIPSETGAGAVAGIREQRGDTRGASTAVVAILVAGAVAIAAIGATTVIIVNRGNSTAHVASNAHVSTTTVSASTSTTMPGTLAQVFSQDSSGVLRIDATGCEETDVGTGFLIAPNLVATAAHVVAGSADVTLRGAKTTSTGQVVGIDTVADVALIRTATPFTGHVFSIATSTPLVGTPVQSASLRHCRSR